MNRPAPTPDEHEPAADRGSVATVGRPRPGRRWSMRLLAISIGLMPLVLLELGLRLATSPAAEAIDFDPHVSLQQSRPLFVLNRQADRWEIPAERMNFFRPAEFAAQKSPATLRVFVLGGSTVQGRPYATETAFSSWLALRLQAACPNHTIEVINCGGVSYASYRVAKILDEVLSHQPDAIVLYTGHNEFLEDRTYADVRSMGPARRWVSRIGGKLYSVRWLQSKLGKPGHVEPHTLGGEVDARLDHPGGLEKYHRDATWRAGVHAHFEATLRRMVAATTRAEVPLVVCLPAADLIETPPFKSLPSPELSDAMQVRLATAWARAVDTELDDSTRLTACQSCLKIDPQHAAALYLAGRLTLARGDVSRARRYLLAARDQDVCPLRATSTIIESILEVTAEHDIAPIPTIDLFDQRDLRGQRSPDGISDPELFVDHVHPTIAGHQQLAAVLAEKLLSLPSFAADPQGGPRPGPDQQQRRYEQLAREHLDSLGEAYYARGKQRLEGLKRWASGRAGQIGLSP